jgi:hypothetical protein
MKVSLDGSPWGDVNPMTYTNKVINMSGVMRIIGISDF